MCLRAQTTVWTYHNNNQRTGLNTNETVLTPYNVNAATFGKLFSYPVDGYVYAEPLYVPNVNVPGRGVHNLFFIATEHNTVYAFDADNAGTAGGVMWSNNLGPAAITTVAGVYTNQNFGTRYDGGAFTDIVPEVGITGTPVIDTNTGTLYVNAFTGEVGAGITNYFHRLHALDITTGAERFGGPVVVTASVPGNGSDSVGGWVSFNAMQENQRPALTLAGGVVYLAYAGYADTDPYHGWIIGYNPTNLVQLTNYTFCTTPNSTVSQYGDNAGEGGIWMAGCGLSVDENTNLYFAVANGIFNVTNNSGNTEYGDCVMRLTTTNGLAVADYFAPWNQATLQDQDKDLGSGGVLIVPDQPGPNPHEIICGGKQGLIYTLNRDQFTTDNSHFDPTNSVDNVLQINSGFNGPVFCTPAYFDGWVYVATPTDRLRAFALVNGSLQSFPYSSDNNRSFGFPGATPVITANGSANSICWVLIMGRPQVLLACKARDLNTELFTSADAGTRDRLANGVKFAVPTVADGKVFVGSSNSVSVFGLLGGTFGFSTPVCSVAQGTTNAVITVNRLGGTNGAAQVSFATTGGTAIGGVHYTAVSGVLNWADGEAGPKTFTVPLLSLATSNLTINLALSNPTNAASAMGPQSTMVLNLLTTPSAIWQFAHFGTNTDVALVSDAADPDLDGLPNLLEYAYAADPNATSTNPFTGQIADNQFQLQFPRNTSAVDLTYLVQASGDLFSWSNILTFNSVSGWITNLPGAGVAESAPYGMPPDQAVWVTATTSTNVTGSATNQFLRLQIQR